MVILSGGQTHTFGGGEIVVGVGECVQACWQTAGEDIVKKLVLLTVILAMILTMLVAATAPVALAQTAQPVSYVGYITSISGDSVLVEEDPQDPVLGGAGSNKGYFTVTGETEILRLVGGDAVAPATFEDLEVGQLVSATYSGPILESYPTQGGAGSIVILAYA
jgi:hypothetical protein